MSNCFRHAEEVLDGLDEERNKQWEHILNSNQRKLIEIKYMSEDETMTYLISTRTKCEQ